jgi:hypothetical protein
VQAGEIRRGLDATKLRAAIFQALEVPSLTLRREKDKKLEAKEAETKEAVTL